MSARSNRRRTSRRTIHGRCRRGCRAHKHSVDTIPPVPVPASTACRNREPSQEAHLPMGIKSLPRRRALHAPIRLRSANDSVCQSCRSATRSNSQPRATTPPPQASSDDGSLDHSSTAAKHDSSPQENTRTPRWSLGKPQAQNHPPIHDAPASHHRARSRNPSQTIPPGCAPFPAR